MNVLWSLRPRWTYLDRRWKRIRELFIVLYWPLVLANTGVLTFLTLFRTFGYFGFMFGTLLMWWGFLEIGIAAGGSGSVPLIDSRDN